MKRLTFFKLSFCIVIFSVLFLTACSKDDSAEETIVGNWKVISYEITNFENTGETIDDTQGETTRPVFEFTDNNILIIDWFDETQTVNYTIEGNTIRFSRAIAFETHDSFEFKLDSDQLILKREDTFDYKGNYTEKTTIKLIRM